MRKIQIYKIENMICIEGQRCVFCGDVIVRNHYNNRPFFCTKNKDDVLKIENRDMIVVDIDNTLDMTPIFEEYFNDELKFEIWKRDGQGGEDIAVITFQDQKIWDEDFLEIYF